MSKDEGVKMILSYINRDIITIHTYLLYTTYFFGGSDSKESTCNIRHWSLIPGLWRSPEEGNGHPLQYSCLENSMNRGAWRATVHGVSKSQTWPSNLTLTITIHTYKYVYILIHIHINIVMSLFYVNLDKLQFLNKH